MALSTGFERRTLQWRLLACFWTLIGACILAAPVSADSSAENDNGGTEAVFNTFGLLSRDPSLSPSANFTRRLFFQLLGRLPDEREFSLFTQELEKGRSFSAVRGIVLSTTYTEILVENMYLAILRREVDRDGFNFFTGRLLQGATLEQVMAKLYSSPEYFDRIGTSTNDGWLTVLYRDILGRNIDPLGHAVWLDALARGVTHETIALALLHSEEGRRYLVRSLYRNYLGREPDAAGLAGWTAFLAEVRTDGRTLRVEDVIAHLLNSNEYFTRP